MLDHAQTNAPQFQDEMNAHGTLMEEASAPVQANAAPCLGVMMFMPFQIAMVLPAAVIAQSNSSSILSHLSWQRERARR